MRRLVRHGLAGVTAATFAVFAGVTALGAPVTTTAAEPVVLAPQSVVAPVDPVVEAQRAETAARQNREAERTRIQDAAAAAADQRASNLGSQSTTINQTSDQIKATKAQAAADAKAALDAATALAEQQRLAAVQGQGFEAGVTDPRVMAKQILLNKFSYGDDQFACFDWIITHESNWNVHAENPSGAYGLPQSKPGSKMASVAADWRDNPATQITWAVQYMNSRYGSPCKAKSHWESHGNY